MHSWACSAVALAVSWRHRQVHVSWRHRQVHTEWGETNRGTDSCGAATYIRN